MVTAVSGPGVCLVESLSSREVAAFAGCLLVFTGCFCGLFLETLHQSDSEMNILAVRVDNRIKKLSCSVDRFFVVSSVFIDVIASLAERVSAIKKKGVVSNRRAKFGWL